MQREARNPGQLILSMSWRAKPLISYRAIVNLISATTTRTGVTVHFELDSNRYPKGSRFRIRKGPTSTSNEPSSTATGTMSCGPTNTQTQNEH